MKVRTQRGFSGLQRNPSTKSIPINQTEIESSLDQHLSHLDEIVKWTNPSNETNDVKFSFFLFSSFYDKNK
jgi:hypothetical protein